MSGNVNSTMARLQLAKEVLAEVPEQFLSFMKVNRIVPKAVNNAAAGAKPLPPDPEAALALVDS